ncbi:ACT domain-containing protein [Thermoanaerobacterium sp. CMT5567-10]|uniref:ACT domain-containing protein n=1 Tax=Thermoanaerobacterium sp. CMT5567-10 TaxID=3061989 RepID=UPI0026DF0E43|nr:ACT domain-containing protein [Thermoanaerobacterium sp. CMT5567-10]WKV07879.1 ACT domain-containing protein [Thermoanaerobacterium sp. CMT5567-10]
MSEQKAIISVIGVDRVGIIYNVSKLLAESNINILDISQTILKDIFTMIMIVDIKNSKNDFTNLKENLKSLGEALGVKIDIQKEDIFRAMHRL